MKCLLIMWYFNLSDSVFTPLFIIMCWKLLCLCVVLHLLSFMQCIRMNSIVRLSCDKCTLNPKKCCAGTLIAPNVVISTAFCADSCQSVIRNNKAIPIVSTHSYPHIRSYISWVEEFNGRLNKIALIKFNGTASRIYVNLSVLEPKTLIGLKAFIPVLNNNKFYLRATVIMPCDKHKNIRGYYTCTSKNIVERSNDQIEGLPLLLNEHILGISSINSENLNQKEFIAVAPLLSWIVDTVTRKKPQRRRMKADMLNARNATINNTHSNTNLTTDVVTAVNKSVKITQFALINNKSMDILNCVNATTYITSTNPPHKETTQQPLNVVTGPMNASIVLESNITKIQTSTTLKLAMQTKNNSRNQSTNTTILTTTSYSTMAVVTVPIASATPETVNSTSTSTTFSTTTKASQVSTTQSVKPVVTNVMQWFQQVKHNLLGKQPSVLILTTALAPVKKGEFVDLTI